jgi:hypothetical protein
MAGPHVKEVMVHMLSTLLGAAGRRGRQGDTRPTMMMTPVGGWSQPIMQGCTAAAAADHGLKNACNMQGPRALRMRTAVDGHR